MLVQCSIVYQTLVLVRQGIFEVGGFFHGHHECAESYAQETQLKQIAVSDRGSLRGLTHFARSATLVRVELAESKRDVRKHT
jgi:hypothetical protein